MNILLSGTSDAKTLGAFYTPTNVAQELANWVVRDGAELILEPSVGEGALILAAKNRAEAITRRHSSLSFLACDINPIAIAKVSPLLPSGSRAIVSDFMDLDPGQIGCFDGIIANPPFTRNHDLPIARRTSLRKRFDVSGAAGLWVHFLFHALSFLSVGGRIAAVIPASGLFSVYGRKAIERIAANFSHIKVYRILDKPVWTNGAEERGAILLAEGYKQGCSPAPLPIPWPPVGEASAPLWTNSAFETLAPHSEPLSAIANISIGLVTGCNDVFLLSEADRQKLSIDLLDVRPIVGRARQVPGLHISEDELRGCAEAGQKTWLLTPRSIDLRGTGIRDRLATISRERRQKTLWFKKRDPWWRVQTGEQCDAIFTYMNHLGPKLVLARDPIFCTNTLHRVRFRDGVGQNRQKAAALTMISTLGQLAAERIGRSYGGGLLKLELHEARSMPTLLCNSPRIDEWTSLVDRALRDGDKKSARTIADEALLRPILGPQYRDVITTLESELISRRSHRRGGGDPTTAPAE